MQHLMTYLVFINKWQWVEGDDIIPFKNEMGSLLRAGIMHVLEGIQGY